LEPNTNKQSQGAHRHLTWAEQHAAVDEQYGAHDVIHSGPPRDRSRYLFSGADPTDLDLGFDLAPCQRGQCDSLAASRRRQGIVKGKRAAGTP
jgi:hypothetical protein